jgi:hypothetical protein
MDGDGAHSHALCRADDATGDFPAIGNQDGFEQNFISSGTVSMLKRDPIKWIPIFGNIELEMQIRIVFVRNDPDPKPLRSKWGSLFGPACKSEHRVKKQKGPAQWPALLKIPGGRSRNGGHVSVILMLP